jgi:hypothetical protein
MMLGYQSVLILCKNVLWCNMFQEKKYQVIKQALPYELANFILNYFLLKRDATAFMYQNNIHSQSPILAHGPINKYQIHFLVMVIL